MNLTRRYPPRTRGRVVVWGLLAAYPFGGMTWQVLHYLAGIRSLGFDVWYVEDSDALVLDPATYTRTTNVEPNVAYLQKWMELVGLGDRWVFRSPTRSDCVIGALDRAGLGTLYRESAAVLNLCGAQELRDEHLVARNLVYVETDPVQKQVGVARGDQGVISELDAYQHLFTYGANLGSPDCLVPVERYHWHPTVPPVVVDWWNGRMDDVAIDALTTVANWKHSGKDVVWNGDTWRWSKHAAFEPWLDLPARAALPLELAVGAIDAADRSRLEAHGWRTIPSTSVSDPLAYRRYIKRSVGEFAIVKEQYSRSLSGWFSDRSVCYLAAGHPAVVQETGYSHHLPVGEGLFAFRDQAEALVAVEAIASSPERHRRAAAEIACTRFGAETVLRDMFETMGLL